MVGSIYFRRPSVGVVVDRCRDQRDLRLDRPGGGRCRSAGPGAARQGDRNRPTNCEKRAARSTSADGHQRDSASR